MLPHRDKQYYLFCSIFVSTGPVKNQVSRSNLDFGIRASICNLFRMVSDKDCRMAKGTTHEIVVLLCP